MKIIIFIKNIISSLYENHPVIAFITSFTAIPIAIIAAVAVFTAIFAIPAVYMMGLV